MMIQTLLKRASMILPNPKGWLAVFFIIFALAIPFAIVYYVSTDTFKARYQEWQSHNAEAGIPSRSSIKRDTAVLLKDEKLQIDKTCLVYKGIKKDQIMLDLYLLELDPEQPYQRAVSRNNPPDSIKLGPNLYRIDSVNSKILKLKILHRFKVK